MEKYTHKTQDGRLARIICTDRQDEFHPVLALVKDSMHYKESICALTADLYMSDRLFGKQSQPFLVEYSPWDDVEVDTPVWVRQRVVGQSYDYMPRHFARHEDGVVMVWMNGLTSHSVPKDGSEKNSCVVPYFDYQVFLEKPQDA